MVEVILNRIVGELEGIPSLCGIVLGGSRATGVASESSDIDIGIYYDVFDYDALNAAACRLDDSHRSNLVSREGEWGNWVNCGGWLVIDGIHVDLIMRDINRVRDIVVRSDNGSFGMHYQTGHPHAYIDIMYRGELAASKVLSGSDDFLMLKKRAESYPENLRKAILDFFLFESGFSLQLARKNLLDNDIYYISGHVFRSVSALNQMVFAVNRQWCLNEKKALLRIESFKAKPENYKYRVNEIFSILPVDPELALNRLDALRNDVLLLIQ